MIVTNVINGIFRGRHLCESLPTGQLDVTLALAHYNQEAAKAKAAFLSCSNLTHEKHTLLASTAPCPFSARLLQEWSVLAFFTASCLPPC